MERVIKLLTIVIIFNCAFSLSAINPQLTVDISQERIKPVPAELVKFDYNNDTLAIVVVNSPIDNLVFEGNVFGDVTKNLSDSIYNYLIYVTSGSRSLKVSHELYLNSTIQFGTGLRPGIYEGINVNYIDTEVSALEGEKNANTYVVNINSDDFARITIDNIPVSGKSFILDEGIHYVTSQHKDVEKEFKVDVKEDSTTIDAIISGTLKLTGAGNSPSVTPLEGSPMPILIYKYGHTYIFGHMLGKYSFSSEGSYQVLNNTVTKKVNITPRNESMFRINEMTRFGFFAYHATPKEYVGFSVGGCRKFGWYVAYRLNVVSKVNSPYGEIEFVDEEQGRNELRCTCWSLLTGPMFRLYRKLYMQVGGGFTRYLQTDEPGMLTPGFTYKSCASAEVGLYLRVKALLFGAGFSKQFTEKAYTEGLNNQVTFTLGFAF